jgi:ABC-2 type transport system ATP-binding protein
MLQVQGLTKHLNQRVVVENLSFQAARGETVGILGPNGAGKTTTFRMLCGLVPPDSGTFRWDGQEILPSDWRFRVRLGVVFQDASLDNQLTARENLQLAATMFALPASVARERMDQLLRLVELEERQHDKAAIFSGGMRRRLELARVLMHQPALLLLDEPTQGLDIAAARKIWAKLQEVKHDTQATLLMTTHHPEEAAQCDRILILDQGKILAEGSPDELCQRIGGQVIVIEPDTVSAGELAASIQEQFSCTTRVSEQQVHLEQPEAHVFVPRLVEAFPKKFKSLTIRTPSLADVFTQLTGRALDRES